MKRRSKWVKGLVSVLLSVVLMVQMTGVAWGAYLNVPIISQKVEELCCWACCGASVCQYYGKSVTLDQFIYTVKGVATHHIGGNIFEVRNGLLAYDLYSTHSETMLAYGGTKTEIDAGRPMIYEASVFIGYNSDGSSNTCAHCVMVTGYLENGPKYRISDSFHAYPEYYTVDSLTNDESYLDGWGVSNAEPYKLGQCLYAILPYDGVGR